MAAIRRLWYVLPLDVQADPNKPTFGPEVEGPGQDQAFAEVARPNRRNEGAPRVGGAVEAALRGLQPNGVLMPGQQAANRTGYGFYINAASKKEFNEAYTTEELAIEKAQERAAKEPKRPFGVFACTGIFETTEPTIIEKVFNDAGELRIKGQ